MSSNEGFYAVFAVMLPLFKTALGFVNNNGSIALAKTINTAKGKTAEILLSPGGGNNTKAEGIV